MTGPAMTDDLMACARHLWRGVWRAMRTTTELDYSDLLDLAVACGLARCEPYDPTQHGDNDEGLEPGEDTVIVLTAAGHDLLGPMP